LHIGSTSRDKEIAITVCFQAFEVKGRAMKTDGIKEVRIDRSTVLKNSENSLLSFLNI